MFQRYELKGRAKLAIKKNYGMSVLVALILSFINGSLITGATSHPEMRERFLPTEDISITGVYESFLTQLDRFIKDLNTFLLLLLLSALVFLLLNAFILNPLRVGCIRFFMLNSRGIPTISELGFAFRFNYLHIVKIMFLRDLYILLWLLVLLIPGIIKSYSYKMVPFLLAENPNQTAFEVLTASENMIEGKKMQTFLLDLSFFGWIFLNGLTFGFSGVLFSGPYYYAVSAELFHFLKAGTNKTGPTYF